MENVELTVIFLICFVVPIYLLPGIFAIIRKHPNVAPILVVNVLLGWTLVGYVVALAWSLTHIDRRPH